MTALLPCPFCGADIIPGTDIRFPYWTRLPHPSFLRDATVDATVVGCSNCGVTFGPVRDHDTAISRWNRRAMPPAVRAVCEEMRNGPGGGDSVVQDWLKRIEECYE